MNRYADVMSELPGAIELDPVVVPILDAGDDKLMPVDEWLASLRRGEPLAGTPPAAELLAQVRRGE